MTQQPITVTVHLSEENSAYIALTEAAMKRARLTFNPSGLQRVAVIKALTAALYTELKALTDEAADPANPRTPAEAMTIGREAATAMTHIQAGAMFAVSAATAHL